MKPLSKTEMRASSSLTNSPLMYVSMPYLNSPPDRPPAPTIGGRALESKHDLLPSRAMRAHRNLGWLALLALLWSSTFGLVKVAIEIPPLTLTAIRLVIAAAPVLAYLYARGERLSAPSSSWLHFGAIALFALVIPFNALVFAETRISSGLASIPVAAGPLFTVLIAHVATRDEKVSLGKLAGVLVGLAGLLVLTGPREVGGVGGDPVGLGAMLLGVLCYVSSNVMTRRLRGLSVAAISAHVMVSGAVISTVLSFVLERPWTVEPSWQALGAVATLAVVSTATAYMVLFHLVMTVGVTFASLTNYLIPPLAVLWGILMLDEPFLWPMLAAMALIFSGVWITDRALARERHRHPGEPKRTAS